MLKDLRFAVRMLTRARGFTATALVVLTLGIGATATMFSATNAVLFRPLPYPDADRIVVARETRAQAGFEKTVLSAREYLDWIRDSAVVEDATLVDYPGLAFSVNNGESVRLGTMRVTAEFFPLFGIQPLAGRAFTRDAEQSASADVLLISDRVWRERFAGAPDVVGRTVRVEGRPATIIGIMPRGFVFQGSVDLFVPRKFDPELIRDQDHPVRQPVYASTLTEGAFYTVPAGKRLVVEYISGFKTLPSTNPLPVMYIQGIAGTGSGTIFVNPETWSDAGSSRSWVFSKAIRFYVSAGNSVYVLTTGAGTSIDVRIAGYLVDYP